MTNAIDVQHAVAATGVPADDTMRRAARLAMSVADQHGEMTLRIVDQQEMQALNARYRDKDAPTNVLSFAQGVRDENDVLLMGDVVICADVVVREAAAQNKALQAHYLHMVVHGTLHLLGFDHTEDAQASVMEQLERDVLAQLGYNDPYAPHVGVHTSDGSHRTALNG